MPLAAGYLKAAIESHDMLRDELQVTIFNFRGDDTIRTMVPAIFLSTVPDVLAVSVFGWNLRDALMLAETFKQLNPDGIAIFGGTHVANQSSRIFRLSNDVDVVVNGEGELALPELLTAWLAGRFPEPDGRTIDGISFRENDDTAVTTPNRTPISDLGQVVSPFLTGAMSMSDGNGKFRYDVAIMETNRGCPYHCAFCYWGGAIGQKIRRFPRERLIAEVEVFAHYEVDTLVLCDANFGMQAADEEFLDDVIKIRQKTGYPRAIEASWAKNKSSTFHRIVRKMRAADLHSSFTIALQTLDDSALRAMNRRNMKLNDWKALTDWLVTEGLECYAELVWGSPGETVESFLRGYDELALNIPRIAVYPLMILPNTDYSAKRRELGLITSRGASDDFEYVLATNTMTLQENLGMQGFLLMARTAAENSFFRHIWPVLHNYAGLSQSQVLTSLSNWFDRCTDPAAEPLKTPAAMVEPLIVNKAVRALFLDRRVHDLLFEWWAAEIRPRVDGDHRMLADEVFRFDMTTLPIREAGAIEGTVTDEAGARFVRRSEQFSVDVPAIADGLRQGLPDAPEAYRPTLFRIVWRLGIEQHIDNHEEALAYMGKIEEQCPVRSPTRSA
ncbi:hypothetical protein Asi02nite_65810 [Asanoa siamensis]|uniref:Radical SAM superfamily enzyme YgiQ, UPF0313 family n=2 Tax=Asanoa siamensis TaxID=926357 RepID=A0ABQ4D1D0_9ACTN|nr:hypothetical protein Asi02nite_65810 [Asanoa siamensis]